MVDMATGLVQRSPSTEHDRVSLDRQAALHQSYAPNGWEYSTGTHDPTHIEFAHPNGTLQGDMPLISSYDAGLFNTGHAAMDGTAWPDYGSAHMDETWEHAGHGSSEFASYTAPLWAVSPSDELSTYPWSPTDQPLPSPLSEVPSYAFDGSPRMEDMFDGDVYASGIGRNQAFHDAASQPGSPAFNLNLPTAKSKTKASKQSKSKQKQQQSKTTPVPAPTKRPAGTTPPGNNPRPRTLKRHKSDNASISSTTTTTNPAAFNYSTPSSTTSTTTTPSHTASASLSSSSSLPPPPASGPTATTTATTTTTLGGVLPANVDPREAAEQISRAAWDRCRAEAREMAQRRSRLLDHDGGALERDALRLQASLGRMRERGRG